MQLANMLRLSAEWAAPAHPVVVSSRVRLARNLADGRFPGRAAAADLESVRQRVFEAARALPETREAARISLEELDPVDLRFLIERHLISPLLAESPAGRGVVIGAGEALSVMVNEEDHLRLSSLQPGLALKPAWKKADALDDGLGASLDFAFKPELGYLTACPTNLGTALRASCLAHLPALALTQRINALLESLGRAGLLARGLFGEGTRVLGDLYQISNATGLGRSEEELVAAVEKAVSQIAAAELGAREALVDGPERARLEDMVMRSVGALLHARLMSFEEALGHLSLARVGHVLGWKVPGDMRALNALTFACGPAHLMMAAGRQLEPGERDWRRAELIRERLAPARS